MRTTIDIEASVLENIKTFTGFKKMKPAVEAALNSFIATVKRRELIALKGKFPDFPTNEQVEKLEMSRDAHLMSLMGRPKK